jgi:uncharacterized protein
VTVARLAAYRDSTRITGVDLARGLAVLGMYGAHVGVTVAFDWSQPGTWLDVVNGRSSILFAVLAGVSIAIIAGGARPVTGDELARARVRILTRAALIFLIGVLLESLDSGIAIILPVYAVLFVAALPLLRVPAAVLFTLGGVIAVVMPVVVLTLALRLDADDYLVDLAVTGSYPALTWLAFVVVGLGVGRLDLRASTPRAAIACVGVALAIVGYAGGALAEDAVRRMTPPSPFLATLATTEAHSGSPFEVTGSIGFALAVIGVCLLVADRGRWVLYPLAAVGAMALTAYTVHVVIVAGIGRDAFEQTNNGLYLAFIGGALVVCAAWTLLLGRGPLERGLTSVSRGVARSVGKS